MEACWTKAIFPEKEGRRPQKEKPIGDNQQERPT
jgi:hypothetical protein